MEGEMKLIASNEPWVHPAFVQAARPRDPHKVRKGVGWPGAAFFN